MKNNNKNHRKKINENDITINKSLPTKRLKLVLIIRLAILSL